MRESEVEYRVWGSHLLLKVEPRLKEYFVEQNLCSYDRVLKNCNCSKTSKYEVLRNTLQPVLYASFMMPPSQPHAGWQGARKPPAGRPHGTTPHVHLAVGTRELVAWLLPSLRALFFQPCDLGTVNVGCSKYMDGPPAVDRARA